MKKYQVTITEITEEIVTKRGAHTVIAVQPWSESDLDEKIRWAQERSDFLKSTPVKQIYGYAPSFESTETTRTAILEQTVTELDLAAVIRAINKL